MASAQKKRNTQKRRTESKLDIHASPSKAAKAHIDVKSDTESSSIYFCKNTGGSQSNKGKVDCQMKTRLGYDFFNKHCETLAKDLLGQILVTVRDGMRLSGKIVETEAYIGPIDKAAHSYNGKKTSRNEAMFMAPGTSYVYNIYGMYCCMNISSQGDGAAVLLRALEPVENLEAMSKLRTKAKDTSLTKKDGIGLCNGPSKLCQALDIKKDTVNKVDLCSSDEVWLEKGEDVEPNQVVHCKRINIDYGEEWKDKPLRFYILGNKFVSVKNKDCEKSMKLS